MDRSTKNDVERFTYAAKDERVIATRAMHNHLTMKPHRTQSTHPPMQLKVRTTAIPSAGDNAERLGPSWQLSMQNAVTLENNPSLALTANDMTSRPSCRELKIHTYAETWMSLSIVASFMESRQGSIPNELNHGKSFHGSQHSHGCTQTWVSCKSSFQLSPTSTAI